MVAPDVQIEDGNGTILTTSEEGEKDANKNKKIPESGIQNGDKHQDNTLPINIIHSEDLKKDMELEVVGDVTKKEPQKQKEPALEIMINGSGDGAQPSPPSPPSAPDHNGVLTINSEEKSPSTPNSDDNTKCKSMKRKLTVETKPDNAKREHLEEILAINSEEKGPSATNSYDSVERKSMKRNLTDEIETDNAKREGLEDILAINSEEKGPNTKGEGLEEILAINSEEKGPSTTNSDDNIKRKSMKRNLTDETEPDNAKRECLEESAE
ncbi:SUMO-activating enzyme subunit 2-like [Discoglossus pictus]